MTHFGNLVLLKSQRSHLDTLGYLVGYTIIRLAELYPLEVMDLFPILSKKGGSMLVNV